LAWTAVVTGIVLPGAGEDIFFFPDNFWLADIPVGIRLFPALSFAGKSSLIYKG